jgi:RNA polymerase sigma factor (sigma-70 family)
MTDQKIIDLIKKGKHSRALDKLYKIYPAVVKSVKESGGSIADAEDVFQDAMVIFIEKVNNPNFILSSAISTFVFGICKNLNYEKRREVQKGKTRTVQTKSEGDNTGLEEFLEEERKYQALDKVLIKAGTKCLELLKMFYYDRLSMKTIASRLGFKSETSAKTQKYKCIEKARNLTETVLLQTQKEAL